MTQQTAKVFVPPSAPSPASAAPQAERRDAIRPGTTRVRLWDLPVRLFHWSLALLVLAAFVTANVGGPWMEWHGRAGIAIAGLIAFRLVWGIVGSTHARFLSFAPTPSRLRAYLSGAWTGIGHNPLGALSVFGLLALLAVQVGTGLVGNDDIDFNGPLFHLVSKERSDSLTGLHHTLSNVLLVLIGLHLAAIVFYLLFKKNNLVKPMVTGWKEVPVPDAPATTGSGSGSGSVVGLIAALVVALGAMFAASGEPFRETAAPARVAPPQSGAGTAPAASPPLSTPSW